MKIAKEQAKHFLRRVDGPLCFYAEDGAAFGSLEELWFGLRTMPEAVFHHHSNREKSDFSQWIGDVFGDQRLANDFWAHRMKKTKLEQILHDRLTDLETAAGSRSPNSRASLAGILFF